MSKNTPVEDPIIVDDEVPGAIFSNGSLNEEFDEISYDGWDDANKEAGRIPLPKDDYALQVISYELKKTKKGETRAILKCQVVQDNIPEYNGRKVQTGFMLQGSGFGFTLGFAEQIDKKFSGKTKIVTKNENGEAYSPWIETWIGSIFGAHIDLQKDLEGNPTNFNEVTKTWKLKA